MNIDHPAVQEMVARKFPEWTKENKAKFPKLYKRMVSFLYFDPEASLEVKAALQVPQTANDLRNRADRLRSFETSRYILGEDNGR